MKSPLDVDYDATAYYLFLKHEGDWGKIETSFRHFMKFAESLGGEEAARLHHVDPFMFDRRVLEHKVGYFRWKADEERKARIATRAARKMQLRPRDPRRTQSDAGSPQHADSVYGVRTRPSSHNVLQSSLGDQLRQIVDEVRHQLPSVGDGASSTSETSSEGDGSEGALPEIFFSGLDWSRIKLPGDEGFSWDDDFEGNHPAPEAGIAAIEASAVCGAAVVEEAEETGCGDDLGDEFSRREVEILKRLEADKRRREAEQAQRAQKEKQRAEEIIQLAQQRGAGLIGAGEFEMQQQRCSQQELASKLLPGSVLPGGDSRNRLQAELALLDASEMDMHIAHQDRLAERIGGGDFSAIKRAMNPSRPKRPSEIRYDDDGFPLLASDLPAAKEAPLPKGAAPPQNYFTEFRSAPPAKGVEELEEDGVEELKESSVVTPQKPAAAAAAQQQQKAVPASRPGRWTVIEHSDDSSDEDAGGGAAAAAALPAAIRGGKGGKGGKGGYAGAAGMRGGGQQQQRGSAHP